MMSWSNPYKSQKMREVGFRSFDRSFFKVTVQVATTVRIDTVRLNTCLANSE